MKSLLIACSEGRLTETLQHLQIRRHADGADRLLVPGGPLALTRPGMERRVALSCIRGMVEGENIRRILLVSHQECGAYERSLGGLGGELGEANGGHVPRRGGRLLVRPLAGERQGGRLRRSPARQLKLQQT